MPSYPFSAPKIIRCVAIEKQQCAGYIDFVLRVSAAETMESSNIELTGPRASHTLIERNPSFDVAKESIRRNHKHFNRFPPRLKSPSLLKCKLQSSAPVSSAWQQVLNSPAVTPVFPWQS